MKGTIVLFTTIMILLIISVSLCVFTPHKIEYNSALTKEIISDIVSDSASIKTTTTTEPETTESTTKETTTTIIITTKEYEPQTTIGKTFYYDDGEPVYISAEEYYTICGIVMNEAGADYGSYEGRVAVAQSIRNQIIREKKCGHAYDIATIREVYKLHYTKKPSDDVRKAVTDVFYNYIVVTKEPIIAWCAGYSEWHSNFAIYVCSYSGNDFYKLSDSMYLY